MDVEQDRRAFLLAMLHMGRPGSSHGQLWGRGMTQGEYFMLNMLGEHGSRFPQAKGMYVSELAELLRVTPPAVSRMLRGLEHKDYVERVVDREDRRTTYIVLRPQGIAARDEMEAAALAFAGRVADRLGPEDTATFIRLWGCLRDIIQEEIEKGT